jgi:hypothetical protein
MKTLTTVAVGGSMTSSRSRLSSRRSDDDRHVLVRHPSHVGRARSGYSPPAIT